MEREQGSIPRDLLEKYFKNDPRLIAAFEEQSIAVSEAVEIANGAVSGTQRMQDATVVTLSPNEELNNEFILTDGDGTKLALTAGSVKVDVDRTVARAADHAVTFVAAADVTLFLPVEGVLVSDVQPVTMFNKTLSKPTLYQPSVTGLVNAGSDAEAASLGVPVWGMYREGAYLCVRRS